MSNKKRVGISKTEGTVRVNRVLFKICEASGCTPFYLTNWHTSHRLEKTDRNRQTQFLSAYIDAAPFAYVINSWMPTLQTRAMRISSEPRIVGVNSTKTQANAKVDDALCRYGPFYVHSPNRSSHRNQCMAILDAKYAGSLRASRINQIRTIPQTMRVFESS